MRSLLVLSVLVVPFLMAPDCGDDPPTPAYTSPQCTSHPKTFHCSVDLDCSDHVYCNGEEVCMPGAAGADHCGCAAAPVQTPCLAGETCNEATDRCEAPCAGTADQDGDGHRSAACGGDDCDDNDAQRFPGNAEVCDAAGHDEDCDAATFGVRDMDRDGHTAVECCNTDIGGTAHCGDDCDDNNLSIVPGSQICYKDGSVNVLICGANGSYGSQVPCGANQTCTSQPNGLGVCHL